MEEKDQKDVIGMVSPVVDEVENIGVINPDIQKVKVSTNEPTLAEPTLAEPIRVESQSPQNISNDDQNKKIIAGVMGIFFGAFGVHNFIYGYTGKAVAQLLITLLSCFLLSWVSGIWGFIEGIMILTDSIKPNN